MEQKFKAEKVPKEMLRYTKRMEWNVYVLLLINVWVNCHAELFNGCDNTYHINPGLTYLISPHYPQNYPPSTSCRYRFIAPLDHDIVANCSIDLQKNPESCSTEFLYIATDGDTLLRDSEQFCGRGEFSRQSLFRRMVIAYASYGGTGRFNCRLFVAQQPCDCGWSMDTKIVNGEETKVHEYPGMVALKNLDSLVNISCGASIISHRYITTAAHCTRLQPDPSKLLALVGQHYLTKSDRTRYAATYQIERIIEHPNYRPNSVINDIALLRTTTDIEWSRGVGPICLPPFTQADNNFVYDFADVIGWGTVSFGGPISKVLRKVVLQIMANSDCQKAQQDNSIEIHPSQICTYDYTGKGHDSCQFDSGGPIILRSSRQFLLGIISFGTVCGQGGYAVGVNTRITSYLPWIYRNVGLRAICYKDI